MRSTFDIEDNYSQYGIKVGVACEFRSLTGRYPKHWFAYSVEIPGTRRLEPITAFATLIDLERDIRAREPVFRSVLEEKQNIAAAKEQGRARPSKPYMHDMDGAKKLEVRFEKHGLLVQIVPANECPAVVTNARSYGLNPEKMWAVAVYTKDRWVFEERAFKSLGYVACHLYRLQKSLE